MVTVIVVVVMVPPQPDALPRAPKGVCEVIAMDWGLLMPSRDNSRDQAVKCCDAKTQLKATSPKRQLKVANVTKHERRASHG